MPSRSTRLVTTLTLTGAERKTRRFKPNSKRSLRRTRHLPKRTRKRKNRRKTKRKRRRKRQRKRKKKKRKRTRKRRRNLLTPRRRKRRRRRRRRSQSLPMLRPRKRRQLQLRSALRRSPSRRFALKLAETSMSLIPLTRCRLLLWTRPLKLKRKLVPARGRKNQLDLVL